MSAARVLVVDDEPQILRALRTSLHGAGYEVETADTAEGALAALAANPPDAVVLDLVLPDGSGTAVCRELRTWSDMPIILLSAVGEDDQKVRAAEAIEPGVGRSQDGGACSPRKPVSTMCRYRLPALPGIPASFAVQNAIMSAP